MTRNRNPNIDPDTGLPHPPKDRVWWVGPVQSYFVIALAPVDAHTGEPTTRLSEMENVRILTSFDGRTIYDLADLTRSMIRDGAEKTIAHRLNRELRRDAAEAHKSLLGFYPPTTLEIS